MPDCGMKRLPTPSSATPPSERRSFSLRQDTGADEGWHKGRMHQSFARWHQAGPVTADRLGMGSIRIIKDLAIHTVDLSALSKGHRRVYSAHEPTRMSRRS